MADYPNLPYDYPVSEGVQSYQYVESQKDDGKVEVRTKYPVAPKSYEFVHRSLSAAEVLIWVDFWNTRRGGALSFNFTDRRTQTVKVVRFDMDEPAIARNAQDVYDIRVKVKEMM